MIWKWIGRGRKAMAERVAKLEAELVTERERRLVIEMTERAQTELEHLPGTEGEKVEAIDAMPETARKVTMVMLSAGNKTIGCAFDRIGIRGGGRSRASQAEFMAKVAAIKKRDNCPRSEAMRKARHEHPDLFEAYQTT